jgi:hypothetical protein
VKVRRGQSSRIRDKEGLQPDDRWTPSHKYAPTLAPINVNLAATIKFGKCEFPSLPWSLGNKKKQAPDFSEARSLHGARGSSARAAFHGSFHLLEGWRDLGAVLDHEGPVRAAVLLPARCLLCIMRLIFISCCLEVQKTNSSTSPACISSPTVAMAKHQRLRGLRSTDSCLGEKYETHGQKRPQRYLRPLFAQRRIHQRPLPTPLLTPGALKPMPEHHSSRAPRCTAREGHSCTNRCSPAG